MPLHHLTNHQLQCCHYKHLHKVPGTRGVEAFGRTLMAPGAVISHTSLLAFSREVCRWGGQTGARVFWRINTSPAINIVNSFKDAIKHLGIYPPNLLNAKTSLAPISGLGSFSYSTKHLRMLAPEFSPVLDRVIDHYLVTHSERYARTRIDGRYLGYADFCRVKAIQLTADKVTLGDFLVPAAPIALTTTINPAHCKWTAADVDMACFAWLQGWCNCGGATATNIGEHRKKSIPAKVDSNTDVKRAPEAPTNSSKPIIFLAQDHKLDTAVTIKEACNSRWNNAWICRDHGSLDFKNEGVRGTTRYLIGDILAQGVDVPHDPDWELSRDGKTCHHGGSNYQGRLYKETVADAVRYLKQFFDVRACPDNETETQDWIDAL